MDADWDLKIEPSLQVGNKLDSRLCECRDFSVAPVVMK